MPSTTHMAGVFIQVGPWAIQRCAICGHSLIETDVRQIAVPAGSKFDGVGRWETGALVQEEGSRQSVVGVLPEDFNIANLPEDFCLNLVEQSNA